MPEKLQYPWDDPRVVATLKKKMDKHAAWGNSYQSCDIMTLRDRLTTEYAEFVLDPNKADEAADVANMALMILWRLAPQIIAAENNHPKYPLCDVQRCKRKVTHKCAHGYFCEKHSNRCPLA